METDKDHIHYMIETEPTISISKVVNLIKSYTTYHIWKKHTEYLKNHFGKNIHLVLCQDLVQIKMRGSTS